MDIMCVCLQQRVCVFMTPLSYMSLNRPWMCSPHVLSINQKDLVLGTPRVLARYCEAKQLKRLSLNCVRKKRVAQLCDGGKTCPYGESI